MSPRIVDKEKRRFDILVAAAALFGDKGFDRVTIDEIAAAAGIGKGTVYEYFRSKDELMHGAFDEMLNAMKSEMEAFDMALPPLGQIHALSMAFADGLVQYGNHYNFFLEYMVFLSRTGQRSASMDEMLLGLRQLVTDLIDAGKADGSVRADIDSAAAAAAYAAWFDGAVFHYMVIDTPNLHQLTEAFADVFVTGITCREGGQHA